jgi:hypothetical protein
MPAVAFIGSRCRACAGSGSSELSYCDKLKETPVPCPIAYVRSDDGDYAQAVSDLVGALNRRRLVTLLGAGISCDSPASLPLSVPMTKPLVRELRRAAILVAPLIGATRQELTKPRRVLRAARLERLLDALHRTHGQMALDYLSVLNGSYWNRNHGAIASLACHGHLPWCITLNFDLLIERAVEAYGGASETVCPLTDARFVTGQDAPCLRILKPHGSFVPSEISPNPYEYLSATLSQVGTNPAHATVEAMRSIFEAHPVLLVAGYSDHDWD